MDKIANMLAAVKGHTFHNDPKALAIVFHLPMFRYDLREAWKCFLDLVSASTMLKNLQVHMVEATDTMAKVSGSTIYFCCINTKSST